MKPSLRQKTVLSIVSMVLLAFIVGLCLCFAFSNRYYVSVKENILEKIYRNVNNLYTDSGFGSVSALPSDDYTNISALCEENIVSLLVMSPSGTVDFAYGNSKMLFNRLNDIMFSNDSGQQARVILKNDNYTLQSHTSDTDHKGYLELWGVLDNGDFIIARSSYAGINNSVRVSLTFFCLVCAVVFVIVSFFIFMIIKPYTDSLNKMLIFAQKANKGEFEEDYEKKKNVRNPDEIGLLGANINELSHKLQSTISELKTTNLRLENELNTKIAQEEARKKYMSDVSHELKTPIALISGYAEGIKEGISDNPEDRNYYCDVIIDEAEKMNVMIKKLATLNQLEQGRNEVTLERFNVTEVIDGFLNTMAIVIGEKGINIYFDNKKPVYVWSDEFLFEEVLVNYFNNAVNHLNDEKTIKIAAAYLDEKTVRVTVFNTGEHIPEEETEKIWSKFYKVDKARTREYGGSGLGLSIVKAVADALGQKCGVENSEGGVSFWIELEAGEHSNAEEKATHEKWSIAKLKELPKWIVAKKTEKDEEDGSDK